MDEADGSIWEDLNDAPLESTILEDFTINCGPRSHTQRRQRSAAAWSEIMPTLVYPLMAALHSISKSYAHEEFLKVSACQSECETKQSTVNVVSFGGAEFVLQFTVNLICSWYRDNTIYYQVLRVYITCRGIAKLWCFPNNTTKSSSVGF